MKACLRALKAQIQLPPQEVTGNSESLDIYQASSLTQAARIPLKKGVLCAAFREVKKPKTKPKPQTNTTT